MTTAYSGRKSELTVVNFAYTALANIIRSSTGMARKNSTTAPTGTRTQRWSESLPMPRTAPSGSAIRMESAAALRVSVRPGSRYVVQTRESVTNGVHLSAASWFLSARADRTHHATRPRTARKTTV